MDGDLEAKDYCESHPHSGLNFKSPREFIRLSD